MSEADTTTTPQAAHHIERKAPSDYTSDLSTYPTIKSLFLAGSINQNLAAKWQEPMVAHVFHSLPDTPILILNPRRLHWDPDCVQSVHNPVFHEQVTWELDALDRAGVIALNFESEGASPISLLELGLYATTGKLIVCCGEEFWRRGNVEMICERFKIPLFFEKEPWLEAVVEAVRRS